MKFFNLSHPCATGRTLRDGTLPLDLKPLFAVP